MISTPTASSMYRPRIWEPAKQKQITITASSNLSEDEIQRAIHDAEAYAGEDTSRREKLDALNAAQAQMLAAEQYLNNNRKTLAKDTKKELKNEVAVLQKLTRGKKPEKMTADELSAIQAQTERIKSLMPEQ